MMEDHLVSEKNEDIINTKAILRRRFEQKFDVQQNLMPNKQCEQNENPIDIILPLKEINDSAHKKKLQKKK
jgi:hypothetical protein